MARAARMAAIEAGSKEESKGGVPEELEFNSQYWIVNRVKGMLHCSGTELLLLTLLPF